MVYYYPIVLFFIYSEVLILKHAIMVIGHGNNCEILQETINNFDSDSIDFFVHWDKKFPQPTLFAKNSQIMMIENPLNVQWGTDSQIEVEKLLFKVVRKADREYDYVHLISASDMPLMTKDYFIKYFKDDLYLGFTKNIDLKMYRRVSWWYPNNINYKSYMGSILHAASMLINMIFKVDRLSNYSEVVVEKGCNWFSMKASYLDIVLDYDNYDIFKHTFCADEFYVQTILHDYKPKVLFDDNKMAARYIDWDRGKPYVFKDTDEDIQELKRLVNTKYAFARKIESVEVVRKVFP